jgi:hypothetical protein
MKAFFILLLVFLATGGSVALGQGLHPAAASEGDWLRIISPGENEQVIGKRPAIKADFAVPVLRDTLLVLLDGIDITQILTMTATGFEYKPQIPLASGPHQLIAMAVDENGAQLQKSLSFSSRHSESFEEAVSNNTLSVAYASRIIESRSAAGQQPSPAAGFSSKIEGNLASESKIATGPWELSLSGNGRYFDQNVSAPDPLEKGFDVPSLLLTGTYSRDAMKLQLNAGDLMVSETPNTIALSRKGGMAQAEYDALRLRLFSIRSAQSFGLDGGVGIGTSSDDHIVGGSAEVKLLDRRVGFRTIYLTGGDSSTQPEIGILTTPGAKKGEVLGFLLVTDLLASKLVTELEVDFADFDPDTTDEFGSRRDHAYVAGASGLLDTYNYQVRYEYFGRDYNSIGNLNTLRDWEGVSVSQGYSRNDHAFLLNLARGNDNVRGDRQFARIIQYAGSLNYGLTKIPNMPVGLGYQKTLQKSSHEPVGFSELDITTDTLSANLSALSGHWGLSASALSSWLEDRTVANQGTTTLTFTLSPTYSLPALSLAPISSWNRSKTLATGVWTDSFTGGLNLFVRFFKDRASFATGSTYTTVKADDGSIDSSQVNVAANLSYNLFHLFSKAYVPTLTLKGMYVDTHDKITPSNDSDNLEIFLVLSSNIPFSF